MTDGTRAISPAKWLAAGLGLALFSAPLFAQPDGYYDAADPSSSQALRQSLHEIIDDHKRYPYTSGATDTWDILELADEHSESEGEIITLYRNAAFPKQGGGYPGDSNWQTGEFTQGAWEVWNGRRGDMARALMYMDVRYEGGTHGLNGVAEPDLILTDDVQLIDDSRTGENEATGYMGLLSVLLEWHRQDPVSPVEIQHHETVASFQGNRNPFIDHPEWAACVFEGQCGLIVINPGMNDAWYNPAAAGQGFLIVVWEEIQMMFVAWFTYDVERPPDDVQAILGEPGHRWLTAQGPYAGDTATLDIYVTSGGVFDSAEPAAAPPVRDGAMQVKFSGCNEGLISYDIPSAKLSGDVPIERIVLDNVALCESLLP